MNKPVKIIFALTSLVLSQIVMAQDKTVNDGVFTAAQAATGKSVYDNSCKTCHDMRFYRDILKSYNNQPVLRCNLAPLLHLGTQEPYALFVHVS